MTDQYLDRFGGIARLYGLPALERFSQSHLTIIGLGGVGSWVGEALCRSGIGQLTLVDLDDLCITNTNRQIHATTESIGQSKTQALAHRLKSINPEILLSSHETFYTENSAQDLLLENRPAVVIDAIDSVRQKCHLLAFCRDHQIPVITSGGAGGRIDATQIQLADLSRTFGDGLLLSVRRRLRSEYHFPKAEKKARKFEIPAVFSPEQPRFPSCDGGITSERPKEMHGSIKCNSGYGAATHLTATFANFIVGWTLNHLATST